MNVTPYSTPPLLLQESTRHTEVMDAVTTYLGLGSYASWDEPKRLAFLLGELQVGAERRGVGGWGRGGFGGVCVCVCFGLGVGGLGALVVLAARACAAASFTTIPHTIHLTPTPLYHLCNLATPPLYGFSEHPCNPPPPTLPTLHDPLLLLQGKRPLMPPGMDMSPEVKEVVRTLRILSELPGDR